MTGNPTSIAAAANVAANVAECEVYVENAWRPGLVVSVKGDGWARVLVECHGKLRELTFSPRTFRLPPTEKSTR